MPTESSDFPHQPRPLLISVFVGLRLCLHLLYGMVLAIFYPRWSTARQQAVLQSWSDSVLDILHIKRHIHDFSPPTPGTLLVANHISWLDIFVLNAAMPTRFVAKTDVRGWPIIGWLCQRSGVLFIDRSTRQGLTQLNQEIAQILSQQQNIGLFPEGTTSEGKQVEAFYPALFQGVSVAHAPTLPACLYYHDAQGQHSPIAPFTGATTLVESIWKILRCHDLHVSLTFCPALPPSERRHLSAHSRTLIAEQLRHAQHAAHSPNEAEWMPLTLLPSQSAYALLVDPIIAQRRK